VDVSHKTMTQLMTPADVSEVPFVTAGTDWFNSLVTEPEMVVHVEHRLIIAVMKSNGEQVVEEPPDDPEQPRGWRWLVNVGAKYSGCGNALALMIAGWLVRTKPDREPGDIYLVETAATAVSMRVGFFGGKVWLFLPRPEFEGQ
jgi:hypothetical protein